MTQPPSDLFSDKILNELMYLANDRLFCLQDDLDYLTAEIGSLNDRKEMLERRIVQAKNTTSGIMKLLKKAIATNTENNT